MSGPQAKKILLAMAVSACAPLTALSQVSASCTANIITPEVTRAVEKLAAANALADTAAKESAVRSVRGDVSRALIKAQSLAACLAPLDQSQSLAAILQIRRIDKQLGSSTGGS